MNTLWLVVVVDRAYVLQRLEYNLVSAPSGEAAAAVCVDAQHELHVCTALTPTVFESVFGDVACCITPIET